jgi:hypothetical protein
MAIHFGDVARDVNALRTVGKRMQQLEAEFQKLVVLARKAFNKEVEEPIAKEIFKGIGQCSVCSGDILLQFRAILTRNGITDIALIGANKCGCGERRRNEHLEYLELHRDHS